MKCSLEHLKVIEIFGYYGRVSEIELIMFFLENDVALERIFVDPRDQHPELNKHVDKEQAARIRAKEQLETLVPKHINLTIL